MQRTIVPIILEILLVLVVLFVGVFIQQFFQGSTLEIFLVFAMALAAIGIFWFTYQLTSLLPKSYRVAMVGYPFAGKTTLIASLYDEAFARRLYATVRPRGSSTIDRVNSMISQIKSGHAIGPTSDQERFGFRADITWKKYGLPRVYEVEFGDFPGGESQKYASEKEPWLHRTEFFKWVVDSDAMVLAIDSGHYLLEGNQYVVTISGALRVFWQNFLDVNSDRESQTRKHPLVLVITKVDLFAEFNAFPHVPLMDNQARKQIDELAFGSIVPPFSQINGEIIDECRSHIMNDFAELIEYFRNEASDFRVVFLSSFGKVEEERFGFNDFLAAVMPK